MAFGGLKKWLEEAAAQVNPFDGGRTAASVRAGRQSFQQPTQPRQAVQSQVDQGLNQGRSWEDIAKTTGQSLDAIRSYSQATRPNYGIPQQGTRNFASKAFDQLNPFDNNRTWQQRTPTDTLSVADQTRKKLDNPVVGATSRGATSVLAGVGRFGGAGTAQFVGGAVDLLTPGKGTNRLSDWGNQKARELDVIARDHGNTPIYRGTQVGSELASMAAIPKAAASIASKVPRFAKPAVGGVKAWDSKAVPAIGNTAQKVFTKVNMPTIGRAANYGVRQGLTATDIAQDVAMTAKMMAHDASRGDRITPQRVATDAAMTAIGNPVAGAVMGGATRLASNTLKAGGNALDKVAPLQTTTRLVRRPNRLDLQTADLLKAYSDRIVGADPSITGRIESDLIRQVRQIGDELGVDLTNGTPVDQLERIEAILNGYLPQQQTARRLALSPLNEGGYARNPFYRGDDVAGGKNVDPLESLKQEARKYKSAEEFVNSSRVKTIGTPGGRQRHYLKDKVKLENLKTHSENIEIANNTLKSDPNFKTSKDPVIIGRDLDTGEQTLIDGYHRYIKAGGKGEADALVMPMRNGETVDLIDLYNQSQKPTTKPPSKRSVLDNAKMSAKRLLDDEGGFVRIPGSKDYPDLSPQQREFINDYAEMLEGMGSGNGVDITPDGRRITNNFRDADTAGRNMTKADWFEKARKDIESGKAGFGASEEYKKLSTKRTTPRTQLTGKQLDSPNRQLQEPTTMSEDEWARLMRQADTEAPRQEPRMSISKRMEKARDVASVKSIKDKETKRAFFERTNKYLGEEQAAKVERDLTISNLNKKFKLSDKEKLNAIQVIDDPSVAPISENVSRYVTDFRNLTDKAYTHYTQNKGIQMGYQQDYLPRIYRNPDTGELLNSAEYKLLQGGSARQKGRTADGLIEDWLVSKDPTELLNRYYKSLDSAAAGRSYLSDLEKSGIVVASTDPIPGFRPIVAEGMQLGDGMNYYAPKDVADKLNRMFGDNSPSTGFEKALNVGAKTNSLVQSLVLSGGVPGTPINAFGIMQGIKEVMAAHPIKAAKALYAGMSKKYTEKLFTNKAGIVKLMAENGIDPRVDYTTSFKGLIDKVADEVGAKGKTKALWHAAVDDPTFGRMMPALQLLHFDNVFNKNVKKLGTKKAAELAAQSTRNFYGMNTLAKEAFRSRAGRDASGAVFFAPRFREAMVNFWVKNAKALGHPTDKAYRDNIKFMVAAAGTYAGMEGLNKALTGNWMHDNPDGKKDKLLIPGGDLTDGKYIGIPFLPSLATVPRNAASLIGNTVTGNFEEAGKNLKSFASMPIQTVGEVFTNEDYFGAPVYDRDAPGAQKVAQAASYAIKDNLQPWVREGLNLAGQKLPDDAKKALGIKKQSSFQTASQAVEAPLRFYNPEYFKNAKGELAKLSKFRGDGTIAITDKTEKNKAGKYVSRDKYDAILDAYSKHNGLVKVNDYNLDELRKANQEIGKEVNDFLNSKGLPEIKSDTNVAKIWAKYVKKDYSDLEANAKAKDVVKDIYRTRLSKDADTLLGLTDGDIRSAVESGKLTKKALDEAIAFDNFLFDNGLSSSLSIGNTIRGELGIEKRYAKGKGGGKGKGKATLNSAIALATKATPKAPAIKTASAQAPNVAAKLAASKPAVKTKSAKGRKYTMTAKKIT